MALVRIQYGGDVESGVLNDNFEYLDDRITNVGSSITTVQSNIVSLDTTLNNKIDTSVGAINSQISVMQGNISSLQSSVNSLNENIKVTGIYNNGTSWYRTYSDGWKEQGGVITYTAAQWKTTSTSFLLGFSYTPYVVAILRTPGASDDSNQGVQLVDQWGFQFTHRGWGEGFYWYACGN